MNTMNTTMTAWQDMTERDQLHCLWSDMYKDAYGFRPRTIDVSGWTAADFQREMKALEPAIAAAIEQDKRDQQRAIREFEARVQDLMTGYGMTRDTAIGVIAVREGSENDPDYLCWILGLPYKYLG